MEAESIRELPVRREGPDLHRRLGTALRQVEWADTYLNACESLDLQAPELRQALARARQALVAYELSLRRSLAG